MSERWAPIVDGYEVSDLGRIKSVARQVRARAGFRTIEEGIRRTFASRSTGYLQICIRGRRYDVHRLVALAFCEGFAPGLFVNHKNGDRADPRAENLEWVTHSENLRHAMRVLGSRMGPIGRTGEANTQSKPVIATNLKTGEQIRFAGGRDAVRQIGAQSSCVSRACRGQIKHHLGYSWQFA